jgi:hypothetical protein
MSARHSRNLRITAWLALIPAIPILYLFSCEVLIESVYATFLKRMPPSAHYEDFEPKWVSAYVTPYRSFRQSRFGGPYNRFDEWRRY